MGRKLKLVAGAAPIVALLVVLTQQVSFGAETGRLTWHTDVNEAWSTTQREGRPLLVFISHENCVHCVRMKNGTFAERGVVDKISQSYVPLVLDGGGPSTLVKDLAVTAYPTTFLIAPDAKIMARIEGYVPPDELMARLAALKNVRPPGRLAQTR